MSWGKVKKINSDMSMPLNELIKGEKVFCASSNTIAISVSKSALYSFTPKLDGVIRFFSNVTKNNDNAATVYMYIYENGNLIAHTSAILSSMGETKQLFVDVPIKNGKIYTSFYIDERDAYTVDDIKIGGQVTDYNYFETAVIG